MKQEEISKRIKDKFYEIAEKECDIIRRLC
jgi:hypothetical protein